MTTPDETVEGLAVLLWKAVVPPSHREGLSDDLSDSIWPDVAQAVIHSDWLAAYVAEREVAVLREAADAFDKTTDTTPNERWRFTTWLRERAGRVGGRL